MNMSQQNINAEKMFTAACPADLLKTWGVAVLTTAGCPSPLLDTIILLSFCSGQTREYLTAHPEYVIPAEQSALFHNYMQRRLTGEPVAYITQRKDFWRHTFFVTPDVLIPKPDTETLIEHAVDIFNDAILHKPRGSIMRIADICTGSGCIAVSLAAEISNCCTLRGVTLELYATDISESALDVARKNNQRIIGSKSPITFLCGDLTASLPADAKQNGFDMIVSNPPYVPSDITTQLLSDGRNEPRLALDGGIDGMDIITQLIQESYPLLAQNGTLLIETGEYQTHSTLQCLSSCGFSSLAVYKDMEGQDRVIGAVKL